MKFVKLLLLLVFSIFLSRAFFVTVLMHDYYAAQSSGNRVKTEAIPASRGTLTDRNGRGIATNIMVDEKAVRFYPDGEVVAGIVGYLSEGVGVTGLEKAYQEKLAGVNGVRTIEETASGEETEEVSRVEPVAGEEIRLNIDLGLQTAAYRALKEKLAEVGKAGVVVVTKGNGEVLTMVSLPSYDPNLFVPGGKRGVEGGVYPDVASIVGDELMKPLFNRAVGGVFPPGSVYKVVTSLAGLAEGVIDENDLIEDSGEIVIGSYSFGNWYFDKYGRTEGKINVTKALARSNDIFFYRLGERLGVDKLVWWSKRVGLGEKTGIDLPGEVAGLVPNPLWREKEKGERWFLGNTFNMAIGQGDLLTTPLQVNTMVASVVTGKKCAPRLVGKEECADLSIPNPARETVVDGMKMVCMEGGTGFPFFDLEGRVICKTGTAQHGGEESLPHAWMSVVLPEGGWEDWLIITVMLDEAGEGSEQAGPVARKIIDYWLNRE